MKERLHIRLQASALSYTLVIILLISLVLSGMVLLFGLEKQAGNGLYFKELARDNLESGVALALSESTQRPGESQFSYQLFDSPLDSAWVALEAWGLYGYLVATGKHGPAKAEARYLYGGRPEGNMAATLFLHDLTKPLSLAGKAYLEGDLVLPRAGLRRGMIGRTGFLLPQLYQGRIRSSTGTTCLPNYGQVGRTQAYLQAVWADNYQLFVPQAAQGLQSIPSQSPPPTANPSNPTNHFQQAWEDGPQLIYSDGPLLLEDQHYQGPIILAAPEIWVTQKAQLRHSLLFAHSIFIEDGFQGQVQAFATDTLETGQNCSFQYPSVLAVSHPENKSRLILGQGSTLEGMLLHDAGLIGAEREKDGYTLIDSAAVVYGQVTVPFNLDIQGTVWGHTQTYNFLHRSPGSVYEHHLLDAHLSPEELADNYAMGLLQTGNPQALIIEALK